MEGHSLAARHEAAAPVPIVLALLVGACGRVAFERRREGSRNAGLLGLPGGHVNPGETLLAAVGREISEETTLDGYSLAFKELTADPLVVSAEQTGRDDLAVSVFVATGLGEFTLVEGDRQTEMALLSIEEAVRHPDLTPVARFVLAAVDIRSL